MSLNINTHEDEQRQLVVNVEVPEDRISKAMRSVAKKAAKKLRLPGFRPGKAPYSIVVKYFGEESIRQDAIQDLLPELYSEALTQIDARPYAQPVVSNLELAPPTITILVPLEPVVVLSDYRAIRKEVSPVDIQEDAIDAQIQDALENAVVEESVERASELGDNIIISGAGTLVAVTEEDESESFFNEEDFSVLLNTEESIFSGTAFVEELVGLSELDEKEFTITFPEEYDYEGFAGRTAQFTINVVAVQSRTVPELSDEFAQEQEGSFETVDEWRAAVGDQLQVQADQQFKNDLIEDAITEMLESVEQFSYPPALVSAEIDDMIKGMQDRVKNAGWDWEQYLDLMKKSEKDLRDEYEEQASIRTERGLIFQQFVRDEQLLVSEEERNEAIDAQVSNIDDEDLQGRMREYLLGQGGTPIVQEIIFNKTAERLLAIYAGSPPELIVATTEEEPAVAEEGTNAEPVVESTEE